MKCAYYQKDRSNNTVTEEEIQRLTMEFLKKKNLDWSTQAYIMKNSWDEEDYKKKLQHYRETGELPEKLFLKIL